MNYLNIAIALFVILESLNIAIIYFKPDFRYGNSMSVFKEWNNKNIRDDRMLFVRYMANWVAGTKLIFVFLLIVIFFFGSMEVKFWSCVAMIPAISVYFITLHPIISTMDNLNFLNIKGYSKTLFLMIVFLVLMFFMSIILFLIT